MTSTGVNLLAGLPRQLEFRRAFLSVKIVHNAVMRFFFAIKCDFQVFFCEGDNTELKKSQFKLLSTCLKESAVDNEGRPKVG
jgi:hypothetical protein